MIQIDISIPKNCGECPICNEYLMCGVPCNGRGWGENDVSDYFTNGRPEWCPMKEQEAELSYREAKSVTHTATKLDDATCPSCGNVVGEKIMTGAIGQSVVQVRWDYCRFCGQKLDWEGR